MRKIFRGVFGVKQQGRHLNQTRDRKGRILSCNLFCLCMCACLRLPACICASMALSLSAYTLKGTVDVYSVSACCRSEMGYTTLSRYPPSAGKPVKYYNSKALVAYRSWLARLAGSLSTPEQAITLTPADLAFLSGLFEQYVDAGLALVRSSKCHEVITTVDVNLVTSLTCLLQASQASVAYVSVFSSVDARASLALSTFL